MTGDMREDQQAFQVLKRELMQLLAVGSCTSSKLSCALSLSHSEDRGCSQIYKNCLVCLWKSTTPFCFSSKPLAQGFLTLWSISHMGSFDMREWFLDKQLLTCLCNAKVSMEVQIHGSLSKSNIILMACTANRMFYIM